MISYITRMFKRKPKQEDTKQYIKVRIKYSDILSKELVLFDNRIFDIVEVDFIREYIINNKLDYCVLSISFTAIGLYCTVASDWNDTDSINVTNYDTW